MLLVAFSRRMCCSRVCSARRGARGRPRRRRTRRRGGRAASGGRRRGWRGSRRAGRRSPSARRSAGAADGDVGAQLAGRDQQRAAPAGRRPRRPARRPRARPRPRRRSRTPPRAGYCSEPPKAAARRRGGSSGSPTTSSMPSGSARVRDHRDRLRVALGVDEEDVAALAARPAGQRHRLGGGRALVEHRGVGDLQAGEVAHHGLEVQQRLEPALADLGLVGRVGRVPGRVLEHVAQDHPGRVRAVVALADQRLNSRAARRRWTGRCCAACGRHRRPRARCGGRRTARRCCSRGAPVVRGGGDWSTEPWWPARAFPLCRRTGAAPELPRPSGPWCLRGSGVVAPSAPGPAPASRDTAAAPGLSHGSRQHRTG